MAGIGGETDDLAALRALWSTAAALLVLGPLCSIAAGVLRSGVPPLIEARDAVFYTNSILNLSAIALAFGLQHRLKSVVVRESTAAEAGRRWLEHSRWLLAGLVAAVLFASMGAWATGVWMQLAFVLPALGFLVLFFPTDERLARSLRRRRPGPQQP